MVRNDLPGVAEAEYEKAIKKFRGSVEEKIKAWKGEKADRDGRILFDYADRQIYKDLGDDSYSATSGFATEGGWFACASAPSQSALLVRFLPFALTSPKMTKKRVEFVEECVSAAIRGEAS